ncbi:hypothetical protein RSAG8_11590, partial [Rhizoctonia solani AG-8 WAC10335]
MSERNSTAFLDSKRHLSISNPGEDRPNKRPCVQTSTHSKIPSSDDEQPQGYACVSREEPVDLLHRPEGVTEEDYETLIQHVFQIVLREFVDVVVRERCNEPKAEGFGATVAKNLDISKLKDVAVKLVDDIVYDLDSSYEEINTIHKKVCKPPTLKDILPCILPDEGWGGHVLDTVNRECDYKYRDCNECLGCFYSWLYDRFPPREPNAASVAKDSVPEPKPKAKLRSSSQSKSKSKSKSKSNPEPELKLASKPKSKQTVKPVPKHEPELKSESKPKSKQTAKPGPPSMTAFKTEAKLKPVPKHEPELKSESKPKSKQTAKPGPLSKTAFKTKVRSRPVSRTGPFRRKAMTAVPPQFNWDGAGCYVSYMLDRMIYRESCFAYDNVYEYHVLN